MSSLTARRLLLLLLLLTLAAPAYAQLANDQAAALALTAARRLYTEKNYSLAATGFKNFIAKYPGHKEVPSARYALALCLLDGPDRNYDQAEEQLRTLTGDKKFPDLAFAWYYHGLARRGQGTKSLDLAVAKPAEAGTHQNNARQRFEEASKSFETAIKEFADRAKKADKPKKGLALDVEWWARASCDRAEMLLRLKKPKDAKAAVSDLATDKDYLQSKYRPLALYYHGFACFQLGETLAAGKSLTRLSPFKNPVFGTHARYLLARVYHLNPKQNEREEAKEQYQGVLKDHDANKKAAVLALQRPDQFKNDPEEKARLEKLTKGPAPDHVARATFFLGVLQYENAQFSTALDHFKAFVKDFSSSPLAPEAILRQGFCEVQLKQNDAAIKTLTPIAEKQPLLADQAYYWIARAQVQKIDATKPDYKTAIETFKKAVTKAQERSTANPPDPNAKERKGEILLDLAETQQSARLYKDAAATCNQVLTEKLLPARDQEVLLTLATAYQLDGNYTESDKVCVKFKESHPKSTLLPAVLFRHAENSAFQALAAEKLQNAADRKRDTTKHNDEAIKRYSVVIDKYPEYAHVNYARHGLGLAYYRKGDLEKAQKALTAIPDGDRNGVLAIVSYNLADIMIRTAPERAEDAVAAGKLEEKLKKASELLEAFVGAGDSPQVPDALLKQGHCQQRLGALLAQKADKDKAYAAARAAYERIQQKHAKHPAADIAAFERAKVLPFLNDINGAISELKKFNDDPRKKAPIAPMALLHLATLYRGQNKSADAAKVLDECRKEHEANLKKDATRSRWVVVLQYHHAVALREAGQLDKAKTLFEQIAREAPDRVEGWDSALRAGQCQKENGAKQIAEARKKLATPNLKPADREAEEKKITAGLSEIRTGSTYLSTQADAMKNRKPEGEYLQGQLARTRARMLYESAWGWRTLADDERETARRKIQLQRWKQRRDEVAKATPEGQTPPAVAMPEVEMSDVAVQAAELQVRKQYQAVIDTFKELAINADARFELAELLSERNEHDAAIKLLQGALEAEKEPGEALMDRIKTRLGTALLDRAARRLVLSKKQLATPNLKPADRAKAEQLAKDGKKDLESALENLGTVTGNDKSAMLAQATYREGECLLLQGKTDEAIKRLAKFRDHGPFQYIAGLSDRALLRLGNALAEKKQWDTSRAAFEALTQRFGNSVWVNEARYGIGWAYQNQAKYDTAVTFYTQVTSATATRLGARAQLNIGLCKLMDKKYSDATTALLLIGATYDYPELTALSLLEAARAFSENKQSAQAIKLLNRVVRDHPGTSEAKVAKKRLADLEE